MIPFYPKGKEERQDENAILIMSRLEYVTMYVLLSDGCTASGAPIRVTCRPRIHEPIIHKWNIQRIIYRTAIQAIHDLPSGITIIYTIQITPKLIIIRRLIDYFDETVFERARHKSFKPIHPEL